MPLTGTGMLRTLWTTTCSPSCSTTTETEPPPSRGEDYREVENNAVQCSREFCRVASSSIEDYVICAMHDFMIP